MRISQEADYAIRVVLHLSKCEAEIVGAKTIAEQEVISLRFLLKLLGKLTKAGVIRSFRGVNGGYALAKKPEHITLKAVIEAIDGPICMNRCLYDPQRCNRQRTSSCEVHRALRRINQVLVNELEQMTFRRILQQDS